MRVFYDHQAAPAIEMPLTDCYAKLQDDDYALIHYHDGLHSLPPRITDGQSGVGPTAMLKHLRTVTPRVIWATTTPAPDRHNTVGAES